MNETWARRLRVVLLAGAGATSIALLQAENLLFQSGDTGGRPTPISLAVWWHFFVLELPVWWSSVLVAPLIVLVSRRFPLLPRVSLRNVLGHLVFGPLICWLAIALTTLFRTPLTPPNPDGFWLTTWQYTRSFSLAFVMPYICVVAIYSAAAHARREQRLALALAQTRLDQLTAQLQPHFLFNALHGVSALMNEDVPRARAMLAQLSVLLRSSLDDWPSEVPLRQELRWLSDYISVQRHRYPQLEVELQIQPEAQAAMVPRFLLQPLVENSVRHVLERTGRPLLVQIRASIDQDELRLRVSDDGPGFAVLPPVGGIGLTSVEERVRSLHGNGRLYLRNRPQGGAEAEIVLPASPATIAVVPPPDAVAARTAPPVEAVAARSARSLEAAAMRNG